jgi:hypothetical protein
VIKNEPRQHYVLVGPAGKQPGRRTHKSLAIQLAAIDMTMQGFGGGLAKLLLPSSDKQFEQLLKLVKRGYWHRRVKVRRTMRGEVRNAAVRDNLLADLEALFIAEKFGGKRVRKVCVNEFCKWIAGKLAEGDPEITRRVSQEHFELPNRTQPDWWKKQKNQQLKNKKSELSTSRTLPIRLRPQRLCEMSCSKGLQHEKTWTEI